MAFQQFGFPQVLTDLGLRLTDAYLFAGVPAGAVRPEFAAALAEDADLAAAVNTEKARSELVISPILAELRRTHNRSFALFSGVDLVADAQRGLNGTCDFLLARSPTQHMVTAPIFTIFSCGPLGAAERTQAKKDNIQAGFGQCIASMVAAQMINAAAGTPVEVVHGAVTTGTAWKFLRLTGTLVTIDSAEYAVADLGKLFGILGSIVALPAVTAPS